MEQSYFTITACHRCRKRKARCDAGIPSCANCKSTSSACEYTDPQTKEKCPRAHLVELERQASILEDNIRQLKQRRKAHFPESEMTFIPAAPDEHDAHPELIHLESGGDGHFLGASSGLHIARSVLQSTRRDSICFDEEAVEKQNNQASSDFHSNVDNEAVTGLEELPLPHWDTLQGLLEVFFRQFEIVYPILVQDEFVRDIQTLYSPRTDASEEDSRTRFMLHTVLSISYHLVSQDSLELTALAERHRLKASGQLGEFIGERDCRTLQCLLLLLLSSMLNPRSAPLWYISGICMRMCIDLGYHTETTIAYDVSSSVTADTKRRLFWVTYCFDRSLAIMLGRPFFIDEDRIEVETPTKYGSSYHQAEALHWLKMKRMESRITRHLHHLHRSATPIPDQVLATLDTEVDQWLMGAKSFASGGVENMEIWEQAHANAKLMLHRQLLIGSSWSSEALLKSYDAAVTLIHLNFIRVQKALVELTWLDLHGHLVSGLTLLFLVLRSKEARQVATKNWVHFKSCMLEWQVVLERLATRWASVAKMKAGLSKLADETLEGIQENAGRTHHRDRISFIRARAQVKEPVTRGNNARPGCRSSPSGQALDGRTTHDEASSSSALNYSSITADTERNHVVYQDYSPQTDQSSFEPVPLFDNLDFPSILGGDFWAELEQFDIPLQPHLNLFPGDQNLSEPHGFSSGQFGGRVDSTVTDSVLNFQGGFEGGDMSM